MNVIENINAVNSEKIKRWNRMETSEKLHEYKILKKSGQSQREIAKNISVPRTTLQSWVKYRESLDALAEVIEFFESTIGLAILHRLIAALHVVFAECGACGVRLISLFLKLSKLDRFVASSEESQRKINVNIEEIIVKHAKEETARLAKLQPKKNITVAQDETFTGGLCLVGIDLVSGFILLEKAVESRDAYTWTSCMQEAMSGFQVTIVQSTSDEAKGIISHVENDLSAHHSPDLFHVQQALSKAVSAPISAKIRGLENESRNALEDLNKAKLKQENQVQNNIKKQAISNEIEIKILTALHLEAENEKNRLKQKQTEIRAAIKGIGTDYHLINIENGKRVTSSVITPLIEEKIKAIKKIAEEEGFRESSLNLIDKASRVVPKMTSTIDFVSNYIRREIDKLSLNASEKLAVHEILIPAFYYDRLSGKLKLEDQINFQNKANDLKNSVFNAGGKLANIDLNKKSMIENKCSELVNIFQRSSSCVEGRNGVISFKHHQLHDMSERKRGVMTAIHNFFNLRKDKKTAAERFFENKPADLFQKVLDSISIPARPLSPPRKIFGGNVAAAF